MHLQFLFLFVAAILNLFQLIYNWSFREKEIFLMKISYNSIRKNDEMNENIDFLMIKHLILQNGGHIGF